MHRDLILFLFEVQLERPPLKLGRRPDLEALLAKAQLQARISAVVAVQTTLGVEYVRSVLIFILVTLTVLTPSLERALLPPLAN